MKELWLAVVASLLVSHDAYDMRANDRPAFYRLFGPAFGVRRVAAGDGLARLQSAAFALNVGLEDDTERVNDFDTAGFGI